ncbi:site-specific integrase [Aureimonas pseudogalii]|uniref:Integrase n=1 Tax=Aureimonas pseudogalii TaxID=1744844 RepID=A0A7W6H3M8_9HYPH|nr:site-specific integrase [Aureimonas pseudogalii]MBB3997865.1 integrase [Aureimonas pseudogalii]
MSRISYLIRNGATYYARLRVPLDLVEVAGAEYRKRSLRTKDLAEAKRALWSVIAEWNREFDDLRSRRNLTDADKADAVWQHYTGALDRDERARLHLPSPDEIDAAKTLTIADIERREVDVTDKLALLDASADLLVLTGRREWNEKSRRSKLETLRKHLQTGETALVIDEVERYLEANHLIIDHASPDFKDLARRMMRAEIEQLERTIERDRGDYSGVPKDPIVKPAAGTARGTANSGEAIMDLFEKYAQQNPNRVKPDTLNQARRDIGTFLDVHGRHFPANKIDKPSVAEWMDLLALYPVKASETKAFAGMSLVQIVKANERVGKPVLLPRTINRYVSSLGAYCEWLAKRGVLPVNPTQGMSLAKEDKISTVPFTVDQMTALFRSPLFTGSQSAKEWRLIAQHGNVLIRDHRYWVPLVMLYSGARPGEIAQLSVADVREQGGVHLMHITTLGDETKSVKTKGSMRVVPIHSELIRLGFLEYHTAMREAGKAKLFPEAVRNERGQMIAEFSREFGRYLVRIGLKDGRGLSLYSFRHGATDAFRRAGHMDETFGYILGHAKGGTTGLYGILPQGMLDQRVRHIESIAYPGLDLGHLMKPSTA